MKNLISLPENNIAQNDIYIVCHVSILFESYMETGSFTFYLHYLFKILFFIMIHTYRNMT